MVITTISRETLFFEVLYTNIDRNITKKKLNHIVFLKRKSYLKGDSKKKDIIIDMLDTDLIPCHKQMDEVK
jgi:hypothetical protein